MSQSKKTYVLSKVKQLIDLNEDSTNFDLSFKVTCHDDTPFHVLVVDQTTLDNSENLNYKETKNSISGNIVADKNTYQNYFLLLKSEKQCNVDVEFTKKELPMTPEKIGQHVVETKQQTIGRKMRPPAPESTVNWKKIGLLTLIIIGGFALLWYFYKNGKKTIDKNSLEDINDASSNKINGYEPEKSPMVSKNNFGSSPDIRSYRPNMKFNSQINNHHHISNRSPDMVSTNSSPCMSARGKSNGVDGVSLLDRLRKANI